MIVVDTAAWIDCINSVSVPQAELLDERLGKRVLAVGDMILAGLLQGFAVEQASVQALGARARPGSRYSASICYVSGVHSSCLHT